MKAVLKIPNFSNYEIYPKDGLVWSFKTNKFIGHPNTKGYWLLSLIDDDGVLHYLYLHRTIYTACYGDIPNDLQVNHIDEDKSNNGIFNLNLMTSKENNNWGTHNKRCATALSKPVGAFKDGKLVMTFPSTNDADQYGFDHSTIAKCCLGKRNVHKGFEWKYLS